MIKVFRFRVKDSRSGKHLDEMAKSVNFVWNFCNQSQRHAVQWDKPWTTYALLCELTAGSSKELGLHSQTVQAVCQEYDLRRRAAGKRWLRWRGQRSLGWVPFKKSAIKVKGDSVIYCGQRFRFWNSRDLEGAVKCGNFSQDSRGRWYINLCCEVAQPQPSQGKSAIGIDLGLKDLATFSTGEKVEAPRFYRDLESKLAVAQRARKKDRTRAIHAKIANRRKDFLHKLSSRLVKTNGAIFVGNVNASKLAKTKMAKSVLDAGWSALRTLLAYKAMARRVWFEEVDEAFSSQTCSECGALGGPKGIAGLGIREWTCMECGAHHDRDVNSARLILALGCQRLAGGIPIL